MSEGCTGSHTTAPRPFSQLTTTLFSSIFSSLPGTNHAIARRVALASIGSGLSMSKEYRDVFEDLIEKVRFATHTSLCARQVNFDQ